MDFNEREKDFIKTVNPARSTASISYYMHNGDEKLGNLLTDERHNNVIMIGVLSGSIHAENLGNDVIYFEISENTSQIYFPCGMFNIAIPDKSTRFFMLSISPEFLSARMGVQQGNPVFLSNYIDSGTPFISNKTRIGSDIRAIISAIEMTETDTFASRLIIEAKVIELLALQLDQLHRTTDLLSSNGIIKEHDLEKLIEARTIIERNLRTPCSLIELSRRVGLNDFKLKKGFKELTGNTVFGYLYDCRMNRAQELLQQKYNVNEVSFLVGYKNPQHFTAAYKKKFGILPSYVNK